jgi:hypothetical protein
MIAWLRGDSAAPNTPCSSRKMIIWSSVCAAPHIIEVMVNPARLTSATFFRPKRDASQPTGAVMIAAATI